MLRALTSTLLLLLITQPLPAEQEPPEDLFNYSSRDLAFRVPPEFQLVAQNRKYLNPAAREVPRFQRIWQHGSDGIIVSVVIWRDAAWKETPKETFDQVLANMLSDPTLKLVSRRSYELTAVQPSPSHATTRAQMARPSGWIASSRSLTCSCSLMFHRSRPHGTTRLAKRFSGLSRSSLRSEHPTDLTNGRSQPLAAAMTSSQHVYEVRPRKDKRGVDQFPMPCHLVACGMSGQMQSATAKFYGRDEARVRSEASE